jgi:hypothetical protein
MNVLASAILICSAVSALLVSNDIGRENIMAFPSSTLPTPTPEPEKTVHTENGVIWSEAAASGVSIPVRDMKPVKATTTQPPREINPQNRFPIKPLKSAQKPDVPPTRKKVGEETIYP